MYIIPYAFSPEMDARLLARLDVVGGRDDSKSNDIYSERRPNEGVSKVRETGAEAFLMIDRHGLTITASSPGQYTHWLVALVEPQCEMRVADWLNANGGIPSWLPTEPQWRTRGVKRVKTVVHVPLLRGYLMIPAMYYEHIQLQRAPHLTDWMRRGRDVALVPDRALDQLREIERSIHATFKDTSKPRKYRVGQAVRMAEGAWRGILTTVVGLEGTDLVRVEAGSIGTALVPEAAIEPAA